MALAGSLHLRIKHERQLARKNVETSEEEYHQSLIDLGIARGKAEVWEEIHELVKSYKGAAEAKEQS